MQTIPAVVGTAIATFLCDKTALRRGTQAGVAGFESRIAYPDRRLFMRSKLALSVIVAASLVGATTIASAQTQSAPGASSEGTAAPAATDTKMKTKKMKTSKMKSGTTTGMSKSKSSSGQGGMRSGTDNNEK
jgi:hypothetical protein